MRHGHIHRGGRAAMLGGLLGLALTLALATGAAAAPVSVTGCNDFSTSTNLSFSIDSNISFTSSSGTCLTFPRNATIQLNGHLISGLTSENGTTAIDVTAGDAFVWGPGVVKGFGTCILGGSDVAVEGLLLNQCGTGISLGNSYKIKEVRIHDCRTSGGADTGIDLDGSVGGFIESSIVRACDFGVVTGENNKIWNLVVTRHNDIGLEVHGGTAVSRTVISSPRSSRTIGLFYDCFKSGSSPWGHGCADDSNSVQDHTALANIQVNDVVITVGGAVNNTSRTNCAGQPAPYEASDGKIEDDC